MLIQRKDVYNPYADLTIIILIALVVVLLAIFILENIVVVYKENQKVKELI